MNQQKQNTSVARQDIKTLILTQPKKQFIASGGTEQQFIKEAGFALQIIENNPYLAGLDKSSIVNAIVNVALTGLSLNPVLKLGYLVPFKGKVYFMSSYMGKIEILMRTGMVKNIWTNLVYDNDEFSMKDGDVREIRHTPKVFGDKGKVIGGYWVAILPDGQKMMGTMDRARIDEIRSRSESVKAGKGTPWDSDFDEMAKKTIINNAFKFIPKTGISEDVIRAMSADAQLDDHQFEDWKKKMEAKKAHPFDEDAAPDDYEDIQVIEDKEPKAATTAKDNAPEDNKDGDGNLFDGKK